MACGARATSEVPGEHPVLRLGGNRPNGLGRRAMGLATPSAGFSQNLIAFAFYNIRIRAAAPKPVAGMAPLHKWPNGRDRSERSVDALSSITAASVEFFFVVLAIFLVVIAGIGFMATIGFMWGCVCVCWKASLTTVGRFCSRGPGLLMVLQQIVIIFMQRVFTRCPEISAGPSASTIQFRDVSWWSEELKFYNAMVVCLCCHLHLCPRWSCSRGPCLLSRQLSARRRSST